MKTTGTTDDDRSIIKSLNVSAEQVFIAKPRVFVKDNWEWCTGTCGETNSITGGCYGKVDCDPFNLEAWLPYNGRIIIVPN